MDRNSDRIPRHVMGWTFLAAGTCILPTSGYATGYARKPAPWETSRNLSRRTLQKGAFRYRIVGKEVFGLTRSSRTKWKLRLRAQPNGAGIATNGDLVVAGNFQLSRIAPNGRKRWDITRFRKRYGCMIGALALGYKNEIIVTCRSWLLKFKSGGRLTWRKSPLGGVWLSDPVVDRKGRTYLTGGSSRRVSAGICAVSPAGKTIWKTLFGWNRHAGFLAWNKKRQFIFFVGKSGCTLSARGRCVRSPLVPPRLYHVNSRTGRVISQRSISTSKINYSYNQISWPAFVSRNPDGSNRLPW